MNKTALCLSCGGGEEEEKEEVKEEEEAFHLKPPPPFFSVHLQYTDQLPSASASVLEFFL